jgi:hypothetical protein
VRRLLLLEAVQHPTLSLAGLLLSPAVCWCSQQQQTANLSKVSRPAGSSRGNSSSSSSVAAADSDGGHEAALAWPWHPAIQLTLFVTLQDASKHGSSSSSTAASVVGVRPGGTNSSRTQKSTSGAAVAAAGAAGAARDGQLGAYLDCCFGPACCAALTGWVLLWHCCMEEAGGDYGCAATR